MSVRAQRTTSESARSPWGDWRVWAVIAGMVVLVGVPVSRLGGDTTGRFGWQMYSNRDAAVDFTVVSESGASYEVDPADYVAVPRSELPVAERLPPHLCDVEAYASSIIIRSGEDERVVPCS